MKSSEILEGALKLLDNGKCWTKHQLAKNKDGELVTINSPDAHFFCLSGAIHKVAGCTEQGFEGINLSKTRVYLRDSMPTDGINKAPGLTIYNDAETTTFKEIKTLIENAIILAKADEVNQVTQ